MNWVNESIQKRLSWLLAGGAGVIVFAAFTAWGGMPAGAQAGAFWAQIGLFFVVICIFVALFWHLLLRPLAPKLRQPALDSLSLRQRGTLVLLLGSGSWAIVIGAFWDELWHRVYGIPFGEDFFWRPHLLMYFGFASAIGLGFWGLYYLNRHLRGNFQQRFRSNIIISLLILNAAFMLYVLPADPFWHWTFGEDLTAWSIPHLILLLSFLLTLLLTLFIYISARPQGEWRTVLQLRSRDGLPLLLLAATLLIWLQLMLIDWDATLMGIKLEWLGLYRPEWLLGANLLACVTLTGVLATRLLRCAGAATAAGLLALALRYAMIQFFDAGMLQYVAWVAALLPLLAIDLWTFYCTVLRGREPEWRGTALAVIIGMALNLPLIRGFYQLDSADDLAYAAAIVLTGVAMSWLAHQVAGWMLRQDRAEAVEAVERQVIKPAVSFGIAGGLVVFIVFFVVTASPPV